MENQTTKICSVYKSQQKRGPKPSLKRQRQREKQTYDEYKKYIQVGKFTVCFEYDGLE